MVDLYVCKTAAYRLQRLSDSIANGSPGTDVKLLLSESATIIDNLVQEVEQYRNQQTIDDDPYRPLWPSWDY